MPGSKSNHLKKKRKKSKEKALVSAPDNLCPLHWVQVNPAAAGYSKTDIGWNEQDQSAKKATSKNRKHAARLQDF